MAFQPSLKNNHPLTIGDTEMYTIISKRPISFLYQELKFINGQFFPVGEGVLIHGGAGVVGGLDKDSGRPHSEHGIIVPDGVATIIDDNTYDRLSKMKKFQSDMKRGVVKAVRGSITDQAKVNAETHDMLDDDLNPSRPISRQDIEDAGGVINRDGSVNITEAEEDIEGIRRANAGKMSYMKKRDAEERKAKSYRRNKRK
jgi:hypothetical protein